MSYNAIKVQLCKQIKGSSLKIFMGTNKVSGYGFCVLVRVTGFEPAAVPRKRRHGRTAIRKGMPQVRNRLSMKNEEPPGGDSSFLVRVTGFEPAAVPRKRRHSRAAI